MVVATTQTVPSARFRALLTSSRAASDLTVEDLSRRSNAVFSPRQLNEIERGTLLVDEATMATLLDLYQVERPFEAPARGQLVIDLVDDCIRIDELSLPLESRQVDDVLERYVSLVHLVRAEEMPAGTVIGLRDDDLDTLAVTLDEPAYAIRQQIRQRGRKASRSQRAIRILGPVLSGILVLGVLAAAFFLVRDPGTQVTAVVTQASTTQASTTQVQAVAATGQPTAPLRTAPAVASADLAEVPAGDTVALSERAQAVEAAIGWDFRSALPAWRVVHADTHPNWRGVTNTIERTVTLFDRPATSIDEAAAVLAHELGHAVDIDMLDDADRRTWLELRSIDTGWWAGEAQADFDVGAGDFAEAVAAYLLDSPTRSPHGDYTDEQLAFVAQLIPGT